MDNMSLVYNINLCRICQIPNNLDMINCSTTRDKKEAFLNLLKFIFSDIVWIDDSMISLTCGTCLEKIEDVAEFKRICLETNRRRATLNLDNIKVDTEVETINQRTKLLINSDNDSPEVVGLPIKQNKTNTCRKRYAMKKFDVSDNEETKVKRKKKIHFDGINEIIEDGGINENAQEVDDQQLSREKICRVCKRKLPTYERLKKHTKNAHPKHLFYHCDACHETFPTKDCSDRHGFKHHGIKKYVCTACGAKYITRSDLTHHMDNHKDRAIYVCKICPDKKFQTSNSLTKHKMLVHSDRKQFKHLCTQCGARFAMASGLRVHLLRHANIRRFSCHLCEKMFCTKNELKSHWVSHSNVRPYKCDLCPAEYKLKSVVLKHKTKVHGIGNYKHTPPKKYNCTYCSKSVLSKCKLLRHIRTHTGVKPFKCRLCSIKFTCKSYVKGHVKGKHNVDVDAGDFNVNSYYDVCEAEDNTPNEETDNSLRTAEQDS